jgi:hypothetical protein
LEMEGERDEEYVPPPLPSPPIVAVDTPLEPVAAGFVGEVEPPPLAHRLPLPLAKPLRVWEDRGVLVPPTLVAVPPSPPLMVATP